jgi:predicted DNA-binding protein (UPF0251 family)
MSNFDSLDPRCLPTLQHFARKPDPSTGYEWDCWRSNPLSHQRTNPFIDYLDREKLLNIDVRGIFINGAGRLAMEYFEQAVAKEELPAASPSPVNKPRRKRRQSGSKTPPPLTPREAEAVHLVGEHKGNFTEAANKMGVSRQRAKVLYGNAMKKLSKAGVRNPKTQALPHDRRGQIDL